MAEPPSPAGHGDLRTAFLEMKSVLFDRNTGLYAYPYHLDSLLQMMEWRPTLGVLLLELSEFDRVEWACGWQVCDRILERMASELQGLRGQTYPAGALLSVSGVHGGSFLLFLSESLEGKELDVADLDATAGKLRRRLSEVLHGEIPEDVLPVAEVSTGYALLRCEPIFRVERLIYRAIEEARTMAARAVSREDQRSGAELRAIIRAGLVETHFQPIIDFGSREVFGYEALARGPRGSIFETPKAMFGFSDRMRISSLLDSVCRRRALQAAQGMDQGKKLFVNSLPATLSDPRFADEHAVEFPADGQLPAASIVLEITERTGIVDFEKFGHRLNRIRAQGFQVAIDDVGTGYSSLQTISEVRPEFLKIDLSLIKGIHQSLIKQEIVSSILQIGDRIGAQVIAEGIESDEEFRVLEGFGVRLGQGFYFGAPGPELPMRTGRAAARH